MVVVMARSSLPVEWSGIFRCRFGLPLFRGKMAASCPTYGKLKQQRGYDGLFSLWLPLFRRRGKKNIKHTLLNIIKKVDGTLNTQQLNKRRERVVRVFARPWWPRKDHADAALSVGHLCASWVRLESLRWGCGLTGESCSTCQCTSCRNKNPLHTGPVEPPIYVGLLGGGGGGGGRTQL